MRLLAIDPGIRGCGAALFADGFLVNAAYVKNTTEGLGDNPVVCALMARAVSEWAVDVDALVVEWPQVYRLGARRGADPNDLLPLAGVDCALFAFLHVRHPKVMCRRYLPREWKGQVPKEVHHPRILKLLEPSETALLNTRLPKAVSLRHNVYDAVGLGLFHLGRKSGSGRIEGCPTASST